ncbi:methyltransferase [Brumimicrobium salinarum]|uniref:Methyltransferase n=1 Tax=Brumimicrobium salinarum TaxID=2058658 RepID=A0A2I0R5D5_9FLAO|nr:class I SAM-dependent methyltransferase [Brumimicrobium salinarum]PKR81794.1 methyltransferase [Brumimicrobium salinarum]
MWLIIREYIKYCLISKRRHGVHSPFMYEFGDRCLNTALPAYEFMVFQKMRKDLLANKKLIEVNDLGAGSKKLKSQRKIQQIAKTSGSPKKYAKLLFKLSAFYQPKNILELGTSLGLGTYMLAAAQEDVDVYTVEGCTKTYDFTRRNFPSSQHHKVHFINAAFNDYLKQLQKDLVFDLVFIDGDHSSKQLFTQLELLSEHIHDETIIVLDDIRWSKDMFEGWNQLINDTSYRLSIDLFKIGILMKRSHQAKEHFVIRY